MDSVAAAQSIFAESPESATFTNALQNIGRIVTPAESAQTAESALFKSVL